MQSPARRTGRKGLWTLLVIALLCAVIIVYFVVVPSSHDPLWWQHAGITEVKPHHIQNGKSFGLKRAVQQFQEQKKEGIQAREQQVQEHLSEPPVVKLDPKNGSEYFADYDVSKLTFDPDPPLSKSHPKYLFHYIDTNKSKYPMKWLSNHPRVGWVPNFMTDAECDAIIKEASKTMQRSQVVPYKDSKDQSTVNDVRTSSQTWLPTTHPVTKDIVQRIFDLTGFPDGSSEMLQVLRYDFGQKYDAHLDYFDPKLYGKQSTNRAITVFLYLSTVEEGGYTQFPRADGKPPTWDFKSCVAGLKVRPVKGTIAFFYDMKPNGEYDPYSLHGGCKPVKGTKWGGTLWLRVPVSGDEAG